MFWKNKQQSTDKAVDGVAKIVTRAAGIGHQKADEVAAAPFMYAQLRARIEAERAERAANHSDWIEPFKAARRAIAALALVAVVAVGSLWIARANTVVNIDSGSASFDPPVQLSPVSACALSATDECAISNEEVLATMFAEQEGKK